MCLTRRDDPGPMPAAPPAPEPGAVSPLSGLAAAYDAAATRYAWVLDPYHSDEEWPNERMDAEIGRFSAVLEQSIREPSAGLDELAAKARLVLADHGEAAADKYVGSRALVALLREVAALSDLREDRA